jgi:hypothetical protein
MLIYIRRTNILKIWIVSIIFQNSLLKLMLGTFDVTRLVLSGQRLVFPKQRLIL